MIGIPNEKPTIKNYVSSDVKFYTIEDMQRLTGAKTQYKNCLMTQAFLLLITEERKSSRHTH